MKEFYKKREFYYFILPFFVIVWILTISMLTLPTAESKLERASEDYGKIQGFITTILRVEPERLEYKKHKEQTGEFDYAVVFNDFAKIHGIPSSSYSLQSQGKIKRAKQLTQSANVTINSVDIANFAKLLSSLQQTWPDLQCDSLSLDKQKGEKDQWKATMKFTYVFKKS